LDGFMNTLWLVHGQSIINTLEIHNKLKTYSKKVFFWSQTITSFAHLPKISL
jgi:hypothetical protein